MPLSKKIFIASSVVFIGALLFWGVYNLSFKEKKAAKPSASAEVKEETKEENDPKIFDKDISKKKLAPITDDSVISPVLSNDGKAISYYSKNSGQVFQIDLDGNNKKILSDKNIAGIKNVYWSPDKNKSLTESQDYSGKVRFYEYDFLTKSGKALNENIVKAAWQNNSKIIYTYFDPQKKTSNLSFSNLDGTDWKKLTDLSYAGQKISLVPQSGLLSFWNNPDANYETNLFTISPIQGDKTLVFKGKFGADYLWSQQGTKLLVGHNDAKGGSVMDLGVINSRGEEYKRLDLPTFASKCVWAKDNVHIFCALPGGMPDNIILPNDYINQKFFTTDTFWKINTETGKKSRIVELSDMKENLDAQYFLLNNDENKLFFVNRYDGKIYRINL